MRMKPTNITNNLESIRGDVQATPNDQDQRPPKSGESPAKTLNGGSLHRLVRRMFENPEKRNLVSGHVSVKLEITEREYHQKLDELYRLALEP